MVVILAIIVIDNSKKYYLRIKAKCTQALLYININKKNKKK